MFPLRYKNLVAVLYLYNGHSFASVSRRLGISATNWICWEKHLGKDTLRVSGKAKNSKVFLNDEKVFFKFISQAIGKKYYDKGMILFKVKAALKIRNEFNLCLSEVASRLKGELKNYKNVFYAIVSESLKLYSEKFP